MLMKSKHREFICVLPKQACKFIQIIRELSECSEVNNCL